MPFTCHKWSFWAKAKMNKIQMFFHDFRFLWLKRASCTGVALVEMLLFGVQRVNKSSPHYHDFLGVLLDHLCLWIWEYIFGSADVVILDDCRQNVILLQAPSRIWLNSPGSNWVMFVCFCQEIEKSYFFEQSVTLKQINSRATAPWVDKKNHLFWSKMIFYAMAWMNKIQVFFP